MRRQMAQGAFVAALCAVFILAVRPVCPVYAMFHVLCPGCGGTRALVALLHGDVAGAWRMNALVVGMLPVGLGYFCWARLRGEWPVVSRGWVVAAAVGVTLFGVGRNVLAF